MASEHEMGYFILHALLLSRKKQSQLGRGDNTGCLDDGSVFSTNVFSGEGTPRIFFQP